MERPSFPVQGERLRWTALPEKVRKGVEQLLGGTVVRAESHSGGFSPGCATRVDLEDGSRFFVKAAGPLPNSDTPEIHRAEAKIAAALPSLRFVPKFLGKYDDGTWVALAYDYIDGHSPRIPWRREELDRVLVALEDLSRILTPSPINAPRIEQKHVPFLQGWRKTLRERTETDHALSGLDPWVERNLSRLARLETGWPDAARGTTLLHADVRADNVILTPEGVFFVDWPWACIGAPWIDLMAMLPSVQMQGGPPPWEVFDKHPVAQGASAEQVTVYLAALTGFFIHSSRRPPLPGLPTLRSFQQAQGLRAIEWHKRRTKWE